MNLKENTLNIRFKADLQHSIHHLSAVVVFLPRPLEICKGLMYCSTSLTRMQDECFSCKEWTFSHPLFLSCSLELCAPYLMYTCKALGSLGMST